MILLVAGAVGGGGWWYYHRDESSDELSLYGNVDLRQVDLAFNNSQRIAQVLVEEGDRVERGQIIARLDTNRLEPQVAQAEAQVAAQREVVERMHNGTRPEEIDQARANLSSAKADAANARIRYERLKSVADASQRGAVSEQEIDNAQATLAVAEAQVDVARRRSTWPKSVRAKKTLAKPKRGCEPTKHNSICSSKSWPTRNWSPRSTASCAAA